MTGFGSLTKRGLKLFFKDKGMLFSSLITPIILLVLYITFLAKVYNDSFVSSLEAAHFSDFPHGRRSAVLFPAGCMLYHGRVLL